MLPHLGEALAAVNGLVGPGLEGDSSLTTASSANSGEVLPRTTGGVFACVTAGFAALWLILEAALSIELLLTSGENKLMTALFAY